MELSPSTRDSRRLELVLRRAIRIALEDSRIRPMTPASRRSRGKVRIQTEHGVVTHDKVPFVPDISDSLISVSKLAYIDMKVIGERRCVQIILKNGKSVEFSLNPKATTLRISSIHRQSARECVMAKSMGRRGQRASALLAAESAGGRRDHDLQTPEHQEKEGQERQGDGAQAQRLGDAGVLGARHIRVLAEAPRRSSALRPATQAVDSGRQLAGMHH